jgi:murein DD-endopeptidase MepM/ murein hydrolase activator NlpD
VTDVRYPSEDQQGRYVPVADGAPGPYGSSPGGYDYGYDQSAGYPQGTGYVNDAYGTDGCVAADSSGAWGTTPARSYDTYGNAYPTTPGYDAYGQAAPSDGYGSGTYAAYDTTAAGYDSSAYSYGAVQDSGTYAAYGTQTWTDTAVQEAPAPYVDNAWDSGSNTEMWYAASDTAAWQSDTWYTPIPVREDADLWAGDNRSTAGLFDDGSTRAPVEPAYAFDSGDHGDSVPAPTDNDLDPDSETDVDPAPEVAPQPRPETAKAKAKTKRKPTRRSFPLTAGAPLAVMGAAAMAVAVVGGLHTAGAETKDSDTPIAGGEDLPLLSPMDRQLVDLRDGAEEFAERASRAQTRISLQERQEEAQAAQEAERKRKESLRPKYVLPVSQKGLSAYYGSSGSRWAHTHTGIDFPVDLNTPVLAVMDGVVRTEFNTAYGNMVILTGKDGTETWYCHLTRAKVRSGPVKAGDTIAYSGDTGNSTGPHLHLEVRPGGGAPINPLPWLRSKGLDPTG